MMSDSPARRLKKRCRNLALVALLALASGAAWSAELGGVNLPDRQTLGGTELQLNGIALRTYSLLRVHIYVAGLYLEHLTHDADAILRSREKKLVEVRFVHDVNAADAREAWRDGFERNCLPPCRLAPADVARFLAAVPAMRAGDRSTLAFGSGGLEFTINGQHLGTITDPTFAEAVLATFIGPDPPTERLKSGLLGLAK